MPPLFIAAAPDLVLDTALKSLVYPTMILVLGVIGRGIAVIRRTHLDRVRLVNAMIDELRNMHESYDRNRLAFQSAYDGGSPTSDFVAKIAEDAGYYPYVVITPSTTYVFASDPSPPRTFSFLKSATLDALCRYHDACAILNDSLKDLREDAFINLPPPRKLAALGSIVEMYEKAEALYAPTLSTLRNQHWYSTTGSPTWNILFPIQARGAPVKEAWAWLGRRYLRRSRS